MKYETISQTKDSKAKIPIGYSILKTLVPQKNIIRAMNKYSKVSLHDYNRLISEIESTDSTPSVKSKIVRPSTAFQPPITKITVPLDRSSTMMKNSSFPHNSNSIRLAQVVPEKIIVQSPSSVQKDQSSSNETMIAIMEKLAKAAEENVQTLRTISVSLEKLNETYQKRTKLIEHLAESLED